MNPHSELQSRTLHSLISAHNLCKYYRMGESLVKALDSVDLVVRKGEFLCLVGASGSGKTTLLNLLGGLDTPTSGTIYSSEGDLSSFNPRKLANYRAYYVGFIFQSFNLIPHRTALENVELSMLFTDTPRPQRLFKAREVLINMGLEERLLHKPADLSAGEQQRVAIARALVKNPKILFADEPTGNLDRQNSEIVLNLIKNWNLEGGTVVMVTHNLDLAQKFSHRILKMNYGKFIHF